MSRKSVDKKFNLNIQALDIDDDRDGEDFDRPYDLTPVNVSGIGETDVDRKKKKRNTQKQEKKKQTTSTKEKFVVKSARYNRKSSASVADAASDEDEYENVSSISKRSSNKQDSGIFFASDNSGSQEAGGDGNSINGLIDEYEGIDIDTRQDDDGDEDEEDFDDEQRQLSPSKTPSRRMMGGFTFLKPSDIHPRMEEREEEIQHLRLLAGKLNADWGAQDFMAPALARRIRDFQFAQEKRRKKYGDEKPFGILGLYDHLASIRVDVDWAEDAAWRRANGEPYLSWADFDASKRKGVNRPFFTYFLLLTCSVALAVSFALNGWVIEPLAVNPMIGPSSDTLIRMGAKDSYLIVMEKEVWRLISSCILHAGLVHFFVNSLAIWFVGRAIETTHGSIAAAILFIVPAIGGTILSAIFLPEYITVGASGGIFGLIGACLSDILMNWKHLFSDFVTENGNRTRHIMVVVFLFLDIALNCLIGLTPYVDNFTHLGGLLYGFLIGMTTMERLKGEFFGLQENWWSKTKHMTMRCVGLIISVILIIITIVILMQGDGESVPCPNCAFLSCVPMPPWEGAGNKWWYCDSCGRVTAEIVDKPSLHLQLDCPDGTNVAIGLDGEDDEIDRQELIDQLPDYCRQFCPKDYTR